MHLTALQLPARFGAPKEQLRLAETLLEGGPRTDLVLFNEAALTGYVRATRAGADFDLSSFGEALEGPTSAALLHLAKRFDCLVAGPLIERSDAGLFNCLTAVTPDGTRLFHYRKRHPWFPETWATPGEVSGAVVEWRGVKVMPAICFDVHFLAEDAGPSLRAADVLLFSSAWVDDEGDSRPGHLEPLAREFEVAVLNANWGVGSPKLPGQGGSMFIERSGKVQRRLEGGAARLDVEL